MTLTHRTEHKIHRARNGHTPVPDKPAQISRAEAQAMQDEYIEKMQAMMAGRPQRKAYECVNDRRFTHGDLTSLQLQAAKAATRPEMPANEIAKGAGITTSAANNALHSLTWKGYINQTKDGHGRRLWSRTNKELPERGAGV